MFWYLLAGKTLLTHDELLLFKFRNQIFSRWLQHSIMARKVFKTTFGLWHHPLERPLFATGAWLAWGAQVVFWRPITDCQKWNPLTISLPVAAVSITIIVSSPFSLIFQLYPNVYLTSHHCRHWALCCWSVSCGCFLTMYLAPHVISTRQALYRPLAKSFASSPTVW